VSALEETLAYQLKVAGYPPAVREYRFCKRRWRLDFAWPAQKVAVEIDGGTWVRGAHNRPVRIAQDHEKRNALVLMGWRVLTFTGEQVKKGTALGDIGRLLQQVGWTDRVFH
jgi:very-short-patch-repair endonuclease